MRAFDLAVEPVRALNAALHALAPDTNETHWRVTNPQAKHAIAAGLDAPIDVEIDGHAGYYCGGMNKTATITVTGNAGVGVAGTADEARHQPRAEGVQEAEPHDA